MLPCTITLEKDEEIPCLYLVKEASCLLGLNTCVLFKMGDLQNVWEVVHAPGPFPSSTQSNWKCNCIDTVTKCQSIPERIGLNT